MKLLKLMHIFTYIVHTLKANENLCKTIFAELIIIIYLILFLKQVFILKWWLNKYTVTI